MGEDKKYVQFRTPDKMRLSELLIKAKGPNRTMAQFSEDCGIGASTLSRIVNSKISKPLSFEMLQAIYDHRDSESIVSIETLAAANGMVDEERRNVLAHGIGISSREELFEKERHMKNVIVSALIDRDVPVMKVPRDFEHRRNESPFGISLHFDFSLWVQDAPQQLWYFDMILTKVDNERFPRGYVFSRLIQTASRLFLVDAWQPDFLENQKTSFVFHDKMLFQMFVGNFKGAPIHSAVSAILVDTDTETILCEEWIPSSPETESVLSRPISPNEGHVETWLDNEDYEDDDC